MAFMAALQALPEILRTDENRIYFRTCGGLDALCKRFIALALSIDDVSSEDTGDGEDTAADATEAEVLSMFGQNSTSSYSSLVDDKKQHGTGSKLITIATLLSVLESACRDQ